MKKKRHVYRNAVRFGRIVILIWYLLYGNEFEILVTTKNPNLTIGMEHLSLVQFCFVAILFILSVAFHRQYLIKFKRHVNIWFVCHCFAIANPLYIEQKYSE